MLLNLYSTECKYNCPSYLCSISDMHDLCYHLTCTNGHTRTQTRTHTHKHTRAHNTHAHNTHTHTHATHTHTHTRTHTHTHTHTHHANKAEFGFATWLSFPDRLVGFVAHKHYWDPVHMQWSYTTRWTNEFSLVLSGAMFCHRY